MKINSTSIASRRPALVLLLAGMCWAWPAIGQDTDTLIRNDGSSLRGEVTASFKQGVSLSGADGVANIGANEIKRILFAGEPTALRQAKEALADNQPDSAQRTLQRVNATELERDLVRDEFTFAQAMAATQLALQSGSGHAEAAKQMLEFAKSRPDSYHFYEAAEALGHLAVALQRFDVAEKYYAQLEQSPWPDTQFRGTLLAAEVLRAQGPSRLEDVLRRYETIADQAADTDPSRRQQQIALLGRAAVRAELDPQSESLDEVLAIIAATDQQDKELLAHAYNALGACHRAAGDDTDAVLAYLHVDLLFASNRDAHAESLYFLSQLWGEIGKPERGREAAQRLKAEYPGSIWAHK